MFVEEIRRAVQACQRGRLPELSAAVWKGFAAGAVSEDEAQRLAELIEARKAAGLIQMDEAPRRRVGRRPRSPASLERRRAWTGSGWMPPAIAARFTMGEAAAIGVIVAEIANGAGASCRSAPSRPGQGSAPRSSATPSGRPGRSGCCTSRSGASPAIGTAATSSRSSAGSSSYGSEPGPGSSGRGVGADQCCRPPIIS